MAEYAYVSKDESYALKHYGVKGMKWHKHLKRKFDKKIGLTERRALEDTWAAKYYSDNPHNGAVYNKYSYPGDSDKWVREKEGISKGYDYDNAQSIKRQRNSYDNQIAYRQKKYNKTPLGKLEKSSKIGEEIVTKVFGTTYGNGSEKANKLRSVHRSLSQDEANYYNNAKPSTKRLRQISIGLGYRDRDENYIKERESRKRAKRKAKAAKAERRKRGSYNYSIGRKNGNNRYK